MHDTVLNDFDKIGRIVLCFEQVIIVPAGF